MTIVNQLAQALQRLDILDSQDTIRRLQSRYMQWCDDKRGRDIADLFWDDATWEGLGAAVGGTVVGRQAIADMFERSPKRLTFTVHYLTNESIEVSGDRAVGRWKLLEPCTFRDEIAIWQGGRYVNDFERRDGEWRIAHMRLYLEYRTPYHEGWQRNRIAELPD